MSIIVWSNLAAATQGDMKIAVFTSRALRHKVFAAIISQSQKLNIKAIFHEQENPLRDYIQS